MCKKAFLAAAGLGVLSILMFGRDAISYAWTGASRVKDSVRNSVPIEFEIQHARTLVKDLVPEIRKNMHVIAKEEVEVERLERQIDDLETGLNQQKQEIVQLRNDLQLGKSVYHYAGRRYSSTEVNADLAARFDRYKTNDATLASLREIRQVRQQGLDAARQKLEAMLAEKRKLEVEVENLDAQLKMVQVKQTTSECSFDDSRLARAKELISDIQARLSVAERMVNSDHYTGEINLEKRSQENVVDQVTEYFELGAAGKVRVAAAEVADESP